MAFKGCHWVSNTQKLLVCICIFGTFFVLAPWYRSTIRRTKELFFRGSDHEIGSRFANGMAKISMFLKPRCSGMQHCMLRHWWVYNGLRAAKCLISPGVAAVFYAHSTSKQWKSPSTIIYQKCKYQYMSFLGIWKKSYSYQKLQEHLLPDNLTISLCFFHRIAACCYNYWLICPKRHIFYIILILNPFL